MPDSTPSPPSSWSKDTQESYVPVRPLGVGGFGSVWLAKEKSPSSITLRTNDSHHGDSNHDDESQDSRGTVAIKVVGHPHNQKISSRLQISEEGYFQREVSVLQEISHPRIVKCFKVIKETDKKSSCAPYCMVLEYCNGPTVEQLIKYGGALGIYMAQEVTSQLIDAISFLHGRAVIHRDIKPDNISKCIDCVGFVIFVIAS